MNSSKTGIPSGPGSLTDRGVKDSVIDTAWATGQLVLQILASIGEFERMRTQVTCIRIADEHAELESGSGSRKNRTQTFAENLCDRAIAPVLRKAGSPHTKTISTASAELRRHPAARFVA